MTAPREDPLAYNRWAKMSGKEEPDTQPPDFVSDDDDEFEDPAQAWIALVEACHIADLNTRKKEVQMMIFHAKNSHWTGALYESELELLNDEVSVEYGGPADAHTFVDSQ